MELPQHHNRDEPCYSSVCSTVYHHPFPHQPRPLAAAPPPPWPSPPSPPSSSVASYPISPLRLASPLSSHRTSSKCPPPASHGPPPGCVAEPPLHDLNRTSQRCRHGVLGRDIAGEHRSCSFEDWLGIAVVNHAKRTQGPLIVDPMLADAIFLDTEKVEGNGEVLHGDCCPLRPFSSCCSRFGSKSMLLAHLNRRCGRHSRTLRYPACFNCRPLLSSEVSYNV